MPDRRKGKSAVDVFHRQVDSAPGLVDGIYRSLNASIQILWLRIHTGRAVKLVVRWGLLGAAFVYRPDHTKWWLRSVTNWIEQISDVIPYPPGDRI